MTSIQDALISAITNRHCYCGGTVDHAGWVVMLLYPEERICFGRAPSARLTWCSVWLMAPEQEIRPVLIWRRGQQALAVVCVQGDRHSLMRTLE